MQFTTHADTAAYTAAAALDDRPVPNQLFVAGDSLSFDRLVREVEAGLGASITVRHPGSFSELDTQIRTRHAAEPANVPAWLPLMYWRAMLNGSGQLGALMNERYPNIRPTGVREYVARLAGPVVRNSTSFNRQLRHDHGVECSHENSQLRDPHACRLYNGSVGAAAVRASRVARRLERSGGSIAVPAGICGPSQPPRSSSEPTRTTNRGTERRTRLVSASSRPAGASGGAPFPVRSLWLVKRPRLSGRRESGRT
jgi:hypothetical protein